MSLHVLAYLETSFLKEPLDKTKGPYYNGGEVDF